MHRMLIDAVGVRPMPYEPTASPFWTDPYLAQSLLELHLDPEIDGIARPPAFIAQSAEWIASLARGTLLDLGCGPGLYARELALRGFSVVGLDISPPVIEHAYAQNRQHGLPIEYIVEDFRLMDYERCFDVVLLLYCEYGALPPPERIALLGRIRRALKPGGIFILDGWAFGHYRDLKEGWQVQSIPGGGFWSPLHHVMLRQTARYAQGVFLDRYHVLTADALRTYNLWNCAFTQHTLKAELDAVHFRNIRFFGDATGNPNLSNGSTLCAVAHA